MRYVIGICCTDIKNVLQNGVFAFTHKTGTPVNLISDKTEAYYTFVFKNAKEANLYAKKLSKKYRKQFHKTAQETKLDVANFRFYVLKVDSINFKYKIGARRDYQIRRDDNLYPTRNSCYISLK